MIIDASALVAIVLEEPEGDRLAEAISRSASRRMAALNWLELQIVAESRGGRAGVRIAEQVLAQMNIGILGLDWLQLQAAQEAWRRFGKGRHPARLNLGDCCAYAASVTSGEPLLFKGNDFAQTDVEAAAW